ncbi:unnamed protein product [Arctia plantaginis]|uniref:CCHC-type domain-containing protein n=1 Tax=Arctia plantaginis TaxID=874455 RepID=A0A8S1AGR9_ARCPL|nr:unnamed protein product [Arctia plantaginis]
MIDNSRQVSRAPQHNTKRIEKCRSFEQLAPRERQDFVQAKSLCFNCPSPGHSVRKCRHSTTCRRCGKKHYSLLHQDREIHQAPTNNSENNHTSSSRLNQGDNPPSLLNSEVNVITNFAKEEETIGSGDVLLATAIVKARSFSGKFCLLRALIDQGSQASFVTEEAVQTLGLKRVPVSGCVSGVGDGRLRLKYMVFFRIQ